MTRKNFNTSPHTASYNFLRLPRQIKISGIIAIVLFITTLFLGITLFRQFQAQANSAKLGTIFSDRPVGQVQREILRLQIMLLNIEAISEEEYLFQRDLAESRINLWEESLPRVEAPQSIVEQHMAVTLAWADIAPVLSDYEQLRANNDLKNEIIVQLTEIEKIANSAIIDYEHLRFTRGSALSTTSSQVAILLIIVFLLFFVFSLTFIFNTYRFIQERKKVEQQLAGYAAELEQSNRELEQFAQIVSHDLKAPLRKIQAYSERLHNRYSGRLSERGQMYLDRIQDLTARMQDLIDDLLTYARVGTTQATFKTVDLTAVIQAILADLEIQIEEKEAQIHLDPLPTIEADTTQMRQLFQNLIENALKFQRPETTPVIHIQGWPVTKSETNGPMVHVTVSDNGIGIDAKYQEKIFEPFQRLHGRETYEGSGIGLAVCRKIVSQHQGGLTVENNTEGGTTFTVILPISLKNDT